MPNSGNRRVPNLFVIGAMKSGTTSLHAYLARHPHAFMCEPKEPGFFVEELTWANGFGWYLDLFAGAGDARIMGESSTHYTKLPTYEGVPDRIAAFNPAARFVYIMRDPLDRMVSHYWHDVRNLHLEAERRNMRAAFRDDPRYDAYSDYARQLRPYLERFGRERVYTLTFEELARDTAAAMTDLFRWLELDSAFAGEEFGERHNVRPARVRRASGMGLLNRFRHSRLWGRVARWVPRAMRQVGNRLADAEVAQNPGEIEAALEPFRTLQGDRIRELSALLGRAFPEWHALQPEAPRPR